MPRRANLVGQRFGRLTVVSFSHSDGHQAHWNCACDCGGSHVSTTNSLRRGHVRSCWCLHAERSGERFKRILTKHGHAGGDGSAGCSDEYRIWQNMKSRCKSHPHYFGKGIKVCEKWANSFEAFLADVGPRPSKRHSIDRYPNNTGNYEPGNVRWATQTEQVRNSSRMKYIEHNGESLCESDWCARIGGATGLVSKRINAGWSIEKAVTTPTRKQPTGQ